MSTPRRHRRPHTPDAQPPARRHPSRDDADATPVTLPHLVVDVGPTGTLTVTLDDAPFPFPTSAPWTRSAFGDMLDAATGHRRTTMRIEVHESDGTTFTDIIQARKPNPPSELVEAHSSSDSTAVEQGAVELVEITGAGFVPGEDVAIALIVTNTDATGNGRVRAVLDSRQLGQAGEAIVFGRISGTILIQQLP